MWSGIWFVARARIGFSTWILPMRQCELGQEVVCWFQCWKNSTYFIWPVLIMLVLLMWKWMGLFLRKKSSWCWGWLSLPNWIGFLTLSLLLKLPPRILEPWFVLRIFPSPEFTLYLGKSTIRPCMEYCCCIWAGAPSCCLDLLYKLQKHMQDCWSFTCCLSWTISSLLKCSRLKSFLFAYFGRCLFELAQLVPLPYSRGRSTHYSDGQHDFQSPFLYVTRMSISTVSFFTQLDY